MRDVTKARTISTAGKEICLKKKPDWFEHIEYYAFRIMRVILFIAGLVKIIRGELHW